MASAIIEGDEPRSFRIVDPLLAFLRSSHETLADAEAEADRLAATAAAGTDVMIYDTRDSNDLLDWAV